MSILRSLSITPETSAAFTSWVRAQGEEFRNAEVTNLRANPGGAGFSNETMLATLENAGCSTKIVIRLAACDPEFALFPETDVAKQFGIMKALDEHTDLPVPHCRWLELDKELFGSPFFVMDYVDGQIPADQPPHTHEGFVFDASDQERAAYWQSTLAAIARVGTVDVDTAGLDFLRGDPARPALLQHIEYYEYLYRWGRASSPALPDVERAIDWLKRSMPEDRQERLVWGDSRPANMIYRSFKPVALLDWELAWADDPECDLAYFLVMQGMTENHPVPANSRPRMPGFPTNEESIAMFSDMIGRPVRNFHYYWTFNVFKVFAMTQRFYDLISRANWMSSEDAEAGKNEVGSLRSFLREF